MAATLLEEIRNQFQKIYEEKFEAYGILKAVLVQDLENILQGCTVDHVPVHARVKSWERANKTAERRYAEREQIAEVWDQMNDEFQEYYCEMWNFDRELAETLETGEDVHNAMHDLLGARVALYFPDDVRRLEGLLRAAGYKIWKILPKGGMHDLSRLRKFSDERDKMISDETIDTQEEVFEKAFSGYGALHFIASLAHRLRTRTGLPEHVWKELKLEIQVGTVVMHAGAEAEHDIIYKPLGTEPLSEDVKRIVDLISGIALTGEVALRQLEATTRQIRERRTGEKQYAQSPAQLGAWLEQYFATHNWPIENLPVCSTWHGLKELFEMLKTRDSHDHDSVSVLIVSMEDAKNEGFLDTAVPLHILFKYSEKDPKHTFSDAAKARFNAIQAVDFLQLPWLRRTFRCYFARFEFRIVNC